MRIYFFIFYFFLSFFVFSQVTTIEGNFKSAQGKWLRLYAVQDFITYSDTLLAKTKIDSSGNFLINIKVPKTKVYYAYFKVNDLRSNDLYIEENKKYYIVFDSLNFEILDTYTSFLTSLRLYFELQNVDTNDLNYKITQLNIMLNKFYAENIKVESERAGSLLNKIPKDKIDSLESILYTKFANYNHPYFRDYLQYAIAEIKLISRSYDKLEIFNQYLWSHRPIYDNVQFMSFFINYFKDFIINSNKIKNRDLISNIEWKVNYTALLDSLGKDTLLRNEVTRELVLLQNIVDWANMKLFTIDSLKKLLDQFYINTKFDHHRLIIRNIQRNMFTINRVDLSEIPLLSKNNDTIFLKQFNTDFILLYFFTSWCRPCIKELVTLDAIAPDICNKIKIIAISADRIPINFYYFTQDYSLQNIDLYYFNQHYELLENLKIVVYPQSILLNKEGYIINAAMPDIKNGLIEYLYNIF